MEIHRPPPDLVVYGLRAMKTVASADGAFSESERHLLATAQELFGTSHDVDALDLIEPDELAAHLTVPALRRQIVRGMLVLSLVDGEASPAESAVVDRFARALGVETPELETLRKLSHGRFLRARFDIARRFFGARKMEEHVKSRGVPWLVDVVTVMTGLREDTGISSQWRALGEAPPGSLGRGYFDFIQRNHFSFPGEKGSPPAFIALHDLTHVLSGYDTDPAGELQVLAFHAGCRRDDDDPFSFILFGIAEFHLGLAMSPIATGAKGMLDPVRMFRALQRGSRCTIDPTEGWDPWPVMHEPLDALRARYGISPL